MVLAYSFCNVSLMPIRLEPSHKSEMVSQLLYGERAEILEIDVNDWAKIRCEHDQYTGWCKAKQLSCIDKKQYINPPKYIAVGTKNRLEFEHKEMWVPIGSDIFGINKTKETKAKFKGKRQKVENLTLTRKTIVDAAKEYLHVPYVWGGRSIAGIDCSGLSQMAFKLCGKYIPRDAHQQAEEGITVDFLQNADTGDLAFFDNDDGHITHVGILIDNQNIIHATDTSGKVVIDRIDQAGIISKKLKQRTHKLRVVKRFI